MHNFPSLTYVVGGSEEILRGDFPGPIANSVSHGELDGTELPTLDWPSGLTPDIHRPSAEKSVNPEIRTEIISIRRGWLDRCSMLDGHCCGNGREPWASRIIYTKGKKARLIEPGNYRVDIYEIRSYFLGALDEMYSSFQ